MLGATLIAAALSFAIEFAQLYETRRVASLADFACNTAGAFIGAGLALAIARTRRRLNVSPFAGFLRHPVAAALFFSWIGYRLAPFALVFDTAEWAASRCAVRRRRLARAGRGAGAPRRLAHDPVLRRAPHARARAWRWRPARWASVLAGRILFSGLGLETAEIAGMTAALLLARPLARLPRPQAARLLAAALLALIAWQGLAPFDFQLAQDRFALLPFGESLTQYRAANLADTFLRVFTNGALVWLLCQAGLSALAATGLGAGAVFAIEVLQTWLPGPDRRDHRSAPRRVRRGPDRRLRAGGRSVNEVLRPGNMTRAAMVYRRSMTPVLAVLLLAAAQADGQIGGDARRPIPATTAAAAAASRAAAAATALPEATAPQQRKAGGAAAATAHPGAGFADGGLPAVPRPL